MKPFAAGTPMRLAVLASGSGSNFAAIAAAVADGTLPATLALCLSNKAEAGVLARAERLGIPTAFFNVAGFDTEAAQGQAMLDVLTHHKVNFIALAGYLKHIPSAVVQAYRGRLLNIHPALLPAFGGQGMYGRRVHEAVLAYGVRWTGVTVHLVDEAYDTGPVVLQEPVPVHADDTPETLAARVLHAEHRLYPEALRLFADGRIVLEGRRVHLPEAAPHPNANPA